MSAGRVGPSSYESYKETEHQNVQPDPDKRDWTDIALYIITFGKYHKLQFESALKEGRLSDAATVLQTGLVDKVSEATISYIIEHGKFEAVKFVLGQDWYYRQGQILTDDSRGTYCRMLSSAYVKTDEEQGLKVLNLLKKAITDHEALLESRKKEIECSIHANKGEKMCDYLIRLIETQVAFTKHTGKAKTRHAEDQDL